MSGKDNKQKNIMKFSVMSLYFRIFNIFFSFLQIEKLNKIIKTNTLDFSIYL